MSLKLEPGISSRRLKSCFPGWKRNFHRSRHHDTMTNMGGMEFDQIPGDSKFRFDTLNYVFILWTKFRHYPHVAAAPYPSLLTKYEVVRGAAESTKTQPREIYFFLHHPMNDIDNWYNNQPPNKKKELKGNFRWTRSRETKCRNRHAQYMGVGSTSKTALTALMLSTSRKKAKNNQLLAQPTIQLSPIPFSIWSDELKVPVKPVQPIRLILSITKKWRLWNVWYRQVRSITNAAVTRKGIKLPLQP